MSITNLLPCVKNSAAMLLIIATLLLFSDFTAASTSSLSMGKLSYFEDSAIIKTVFSLTEMIKINDKKLNEWKSSKFTYIR